MDAWIDRGQGPGSYDPGPWPATGPSKVRRAATYTTALLHTWWKSLNP